MTGTGVTYNALRNGSITDDDVTCDLVPPGPPPPEAAPAALARAAAAGAVRHSEARLLACRTGHLVGTARTWPPSPRPPGPTCASRPPGSSPGTTRPPGSAVPVPMTPARPSPAPPPGRCPCPRWPARWSPRRPAAGPRPPRPAGTACCPHRCGPGSSGTRRSRPGGGTWSSPAPGTPPPASTPAFLTVAQLGYWLTPAEAAGLPPAEQAALLLVRSAAQDPEAPVWPLGSDDARALARGHPAPAPQPSPGRSALARLWGTRPGDAAALTAAARDRGFVTACAALRAAMRAQPG